jgi:hypothetical protein
LVGAVDDAEQRTDSKLLTDLEPWFEVLPAPRVHADLTTLAAFPAAYEDRATTRVKIALRERERLADP